MSANLKAKAVVDAWLDSENAIKLHGHALSDEQLHVAQEALVEAQQALEANEVRAAQQQLASVKHALELLRKALQSSQPEVQKALTSLSAVVINDVQSARLAAPAVNSAAQAEQHAAGEQIQQVFGGMITGAGALVAATPTFMASILDHRTMEGINKWVGNMVGEIQNLTAGDLFTSKIAAGGPAFTVKSKEQQIFAW